VSSHTIAARGSRCVTGSFAKPSGGFSFDKSGFKIENAIAKRFQLFMVHKILNKCSYTEKMGLISDCDSG
jgi:hypothetical protein